MQKCRPLKESRGIPAGSKVASAFARRKKLLNGVHPATGCKLEVIVGHTPVLPRSISQGSRAGSSADCEAPLLASGIEDGEDCALSFDEHQAFAALFGVR